MKRPLLWGGILVIGLVIAGGLYLCVACRPGPDG